jgi:hypothetical protein
MISPAPELLDRKWIALASHRGWLLQQAEALFSFFDRGIINPLGGFCDLDDGALSSFNLQNGFSLRDSSWVGQARILLSIAESVL